jgi:hypothetical protein
MYVEAKSGDIVYDRVESDFAGFDVFLEAIGNTVSVWGDNYPDTYSEFNAPADGEETPVPPADDDTTAPEEETEAPAVPDDPEDTSDSDETTSEVTEEIGDIEDDENENSSVTVKANTITIKIGDGKIEVK